MRLSILTLIFKMEITQVLICCVKSEASHRVLLRLLSKIHEKESVAILDINL